MPDSWEKHVELMFDLQLLAFATDITRVSAFKMCRDTSNRVFPESGVKAPFHTLSHQGMRKFTCGKPATVWGASLDVARR